MRRMFSKKQIGEIAKLKIQQGFTASPDAKMQVFENITDKDGNPRFVEGDITMETITGVTQTYGKWSLSGSHLMIVVAGIIENNTSLAINTDITLPEYIFNKITPFHNLLIDIKTLTLYGDDGTTQSMKIGLRRQETFLNIFRLEPIVTTTEKREFRIQFDLLIDDE